MSIPVQTVIDQAKAALDAEGQGDYYRFDRDFKPAINYAIDWLLSVINSAFGDKKIGEEIFQEITKVKIFQTSDFSRIKFDQATIGHEIWTILAVYPKPNTLPVGTNPNVPGSPTLETSFFVDNLSFRDSDFSAKRLTLEEWNQNKGNPFVPGNTVFKSACPDVISYAYLAYADYTSTNYTVNIPREIEIRPEAKRELVAVAYAKVPTKILLITDNIEFNISLLNLVVNKTLDYIAYKQGDETTLKGVTTEDIATLIRTIQ